MLRKSLLITFLFLFGWSAYAQSGLDTLDLEDIFFEPYLPGVRPAMINFSADMQELYFSWNDSAYIETGTYRVDLNGQNIEEAPEDIVTRYSVSPDGQKFVYTKDSKIMISDRQLGDPRTLIATKSRPGNPTWSHDSKRVAYTLEGDVWYVDIETASVVQVTDREEGSPGYSIEGWLTDNRLALRSTDFSDARTLYFPDYLGDFVEPGESTRGIPITTFIVAHSDSAKPDTLFSGQHRSSTDISSTGRYLAVDYADAALKERKIKVYDFQEDNMTVVFEDSTEGWLYNTNMQFVPNGDKLMLQSERDNWNHIYTVNPDGSNLRQHTRGKFDIPWAEWIDESRIVYASTEIDPGERHIYIINTTNNNVQKLTTREAYRYRFRLGPDKRYIVYAKTFFNEPYDLYILDLQEPGNEVRLTHSVPDRFQQIEWQKEDYLRFTGRDGETELSMSVLYPPEFDPSIEHPVVVFVHGAGSLQNVYKGWSNNYWREYMFHQILNQHGYVVVEVDYRHSTGYGRKFREDVTDWMGKYETIDIVDGLDWLQENVGGLDLESVGIYGGSYGGFMALYAASAEPERFHAAAALRAVTNWRNYYYANPWYTLPRLGDPEEDPEHYDRSSPLTYANEMERPVLILHGLIDDNVGFQDAVQYIEELIQAGHEEFDMMMYPSEPHGFTSPESWYDEYRRIFEFFEEYVK